ncbi:penicillin-binding protein 2 [Candidatus Uhrbacteria bacterium]|nr:penicillin-binding protein 2 [Candidatus Uhrbacteria bacterium]
MKPQSPFLIQPMDALGEIKTPMEDFDFEDAIGDDARQIRQASFLGSSITSRRTMIGGVIAILILGLFVTRAAYLQILNGSYFFGLAEGNRIQNERIVADRGLIMDRSGQIIARNVPAFSLWVDTDKLEDDENYLSIVQSTSELLGITENEAHDILIELDDDKPELLLSQDVEFDSAMRVLASQENYPGLRIEAGNRRLFDVNGTKTLSSLLGYVGVINKEEYEIRRKQGYSQRDIVGKAGIEREYQDLLRGYPGERSVEVDAIGREQSILEQRDAVGGANLTLHIDTELQAFIEIKLDEIIDKIGVKNASVVVMDPRDGGVRALVSYPGFDSNIFSGVIDADEYLALIENPAAPLFTRAVSGQFPSGSTFKPIVAAAAIDAGIIDERTTIISNGGIRIGQFYFPDWKAGGHGVTNVRKAIAESVNTFFYMIGGGFKEFDGLGLEAMMSSASQFGLGQALGIDLPGEASGFLPSVEWKNRVKNEPWYIGDTYHASIGQGDILVTPLQVAAFTSAFANGGIMYKPQIVDGYESQGKYHDTTPVVISEQPASAEARDCSKGIARCGTYRVCKTTCKFTGKLGRKDRDGAMAHGER